MLETAKCATTLVVRTLVWAGGDLILGLGRHGCGGGGVCSCGGGHGMMSRYGVVRHGGHGRGEEREGEWGIEWHRYLREKGKG